MEKKKLILKKETIAILNSDQMGKVRGGAGTTTLNDGCVIMRTQEVTTCEKPQPVTYYCKPTENDSCNCPLETAGICLVPVSVDRNCESEKICGMTMEEGCAVIGSRIGDQTCPCPSGVICQ